MGASNTIETDSRGLYSNYTPEERHDRLRDQAEAEYRIYQRFGRPSRPYYGKCTACSGDDAMWECGGSLMDALHDARYHAGVHSGLYEEHAEIILVSGHGREITRIHALFKPGDGPEPCKGCGEPRRQPHPMVAGTDGRIACQNCGHIPEEARW